MATAPLCAGTQVVAQWMGHGWYAGEITKDNGDNTYGVFFFGSWADGNFLPAVPAAEIALLALPSQLPTAGCQGTPSGAFSPASAHAAAAFPCSSSFVSTAAASEPPPSPPPRGSPPPTGVPAEALPKKVTINSLEEFKRSYRATIELAATVLSDIAADRCTFTESQAENGKPRYTVCIPRRIYTDIRRYLELCWNRNYRVEGARWGWECVEANTTSAGVH
eukprot:TRINITY_DN46787_c0_g1_i1.p1 TRINITY_DN46787_c0_g1~~TRINITY_DN46787_c0_g1_i1.p1  ORF type:complete len:257 (+),score=58.09 TRINITY_DN46787_c0_g1_i1:110-772(+)